MFRSEFENLKLKELVEIVIDYGGYEIITRGEMVDKTKNDVDSGDFDEAIEKLNVLNREGYYFIKHSLLNNYIYYDVFDEYDARKIIEKEKLIDIEEEPTEEDIYWNYLERQAEAKREEELFGRD